MASGPEALNRLETSLVRAGLVIRAERLWPVVCVALCAAASFLTLSWLGLWLVVPLWARLLGLAGLALVLIGAGVAMIRSPRVTRSDALARLDRDSGIGHRPVSATQDRLSDPSPDPFTQALWDLHRRRSAGAAAAVRLALPSPRLVDRDRYGLRFGIVVAMVAAAFVAGSDKEGRLASAFAWPGAASPGAGFRIDAWIDPPGYTGRAPVLLFGQASPMAQPAQPIAAPIHSVVVVRSSGQGQIDVEVDGALKAASGLPPKSASAGSEHRFSLDGDGHLTLSHDGTVQSTFALHAIPDLPPTIVSTAPARSNLRGSLTLSYKAEDDYGVVGVDAMLSDPKIDGKPVTGRTLVEAPKIVLNLPGAARGLGAGQTTLDLSQHPWAGVDGTLVLRARDEGGNVGIGAPIDVHLPTRPFHKPLAKALVEQRRHLVFDPDQPGEVVEALDALSLAPEIFDTSASIYLGLRTAKSRLEAATGDPDLVAVADLLWTMALSIEDGDLSQTERDLRALQRELKDALARGAPPEEIRKLTDALRAQMEKFLAEMAQRNAAARDEQAPPSGPTKTVTSKDLQALLDKMEQAARNGDMAEAQQLLDRLQTILENLRSAQGGESDPGSQQMNKSMGQIDRMMHDQQALRDKTYRRGNRPRPPSKSQPRDGEDPSNESEPDDQAQGDQSRQEPSEPSDNGDLQGQQRKLRDALANVQKQMRDMGMNGEPGFGEAEQAMKDAEAALGQGAPGNDRAVEAQGRALQGLQQGARGLQGQMAQGQGDGDGQMPGETGMGRAEGGQEDGTDPLGRARGKQGNEGFSPEGPGKTPGDVAERARQVLEELRRRLGDRQRPQAEQDYLERLLKRY